MRLLAICMVPTISLTLLASGVEGSAKSPRAKAVLEFNAPATVLSAVVRGDQVYVTYSNLVVAAYEFPTSFNSQEPLMFGGYRELISPKTLKSAPGNGDATYTYTDNTGGTIVVRQNCRGLSDEKCAKLLRNRVTKFKELFPPKRDRERDNGGWKEIAEG